jgi:hypothetical protein
LIRDVLLLTSRDWETTNARAAATGSSDGVRTRFFAEMWFWVFSNADWLRSIPCKPESKI